MEQPRPYYGVVIDESLKGVRQHLEALAGAARAETKSRGPDSEVEAALARLDRALKALGG